MSDMDPRDIGVSVIRAADDANVPARLLGGVAVALHCPTASLPAFQRQYEDIDVVIEKRGRKHIDAIARSCGFEPDIEFNNLHGLERRTYYSERHGKMDVFVGRFSMCHSLSFEGRLEADHPTVSLADLVLTKAQIYELNLKDAHDLIALLADHPVASGDDETINADRIGDVCGKDWGFWRTVTRTFETIEQIVRSEPVLAPQRETVVSALAVLRRELERAPKSSKWKMRSKVGDRKSWYALPEDPDRKPAVA